MTKSLLIFDIDNTLVASYGIYDEAYRLTSRQILGKEFVMTKNPDGSIDTTFSKMSNPEILKSRVVQLGIDPAGIDEKRFFEKFDENAKQAAEIADFTVFAGVVNFVRALGNNRKLVILTSGSKKLQTTILERAGLSEYFDLSQSLFLGDYKSKQEAIEKIYQQNQTSTVAHFGDAPKDMTAIHNADIKATKVAVGVTFAGLSTSEELRKAGADFVIERFDDATLRELDKVV